MNRPRRPGQYDDRFLECQESMEDHFNDIMDAARAAGWTPAEAAAAVVELADNYMLKQFAIEDTKAKIALVVDRESRRRHKR